MPEEKSMTLEDFLKDKDLGSVVEVRLEKGYFVIEDKEHRTLHVVKKTCALDITGERKRILGYLQDRDSNGTAGFENRKVLQILTNDGFKAYVDHGLVFSISYYRDPDRWRSTDKPR